MRRALAGVQVRDVDVLRREARAVGALDLDAVATDADLDQVRHEPGEGAVDEDARTDQGLARDDEVADLGRRAAGAAAGRLRAAAAAAGVGGPSRAVGRFSDRGAAA